MQKSHGRRGKKHEERERCGQTQKGSSLSNPHRILPAGSETLHHNRRAGEEHQQKSPGQSENALKQREEIPVCRPGASPRSSGRERHGQHAVSEKLTQGVRYDGCCHECVGKPARAHQPGHGQIPDKSQQTGHHCPQGQKNDPPHPSAPARFPSVRSARGLMNSHTRIFQDSVTDGEDQVPSSIRARIRADPLPRRQEVCGNVRQTRVCECLRGERRGLSPSPSPDQGV